MIKNALTNGGDDGDTVEQCSWKAPLAWLLHYIALDCFLAVVSICLHLITRSIFSGHNNKLIHLHDHIFFKSLQDLFRIPGPVCLPEDVEVLCDWVGVSTVYPTLDRRSRRKAVCTHTWRLIPNTSSRLVWRNDVLWYGFLPLPRVLSANSTIWTQVRRAWIL